MKTYATCGLTIIFCSSLFTANAQSAGEFSGIKSNDALKIVISQSNENTISIAPEEMQSSIKTKIKDDVLVISTEGKIKSDKPITVSVGIKSLKSLDVSGSAEVKSGNELQCNLLNIESGGAGDINLDVKANEIKIKINGAGDVNLKGNAQLLDASVSGAGELKAFNLETNKAKVKVSGAGDVKINVSQMLDADVSGAGSVIYKGNPQERNVNISGAGSVRQTTGDDLAKSKGKDSKITVDISLDTDDISVEEDTIEPENPDTTRIKLKKMQVLIIQDEENKKDEPKAKKDKKAKTEKNKHWSGLYLGVNGFAAPDNSLNLPVNSKFMDLNYSKSIHFAFNFLEKDIRLHREYVKLVTGMGFDFNSYSFKNNSTLFSNSDSVWSMTDSVNKFTKNKLKSTYINVPLMLAFNTNKNSKKAFHIVAGVIGGYNLSTKTKQRFYIGKEEVNAKIRNDYNINPFRLSATAQVGYGDFVLYGSYALNTLFEKNKGPELYPFTVGVRIMGL